MWILLASLAHGGATVRAPLATTCFPACSTGYLCNQGVCVEACNPSCGDDERCSADRVCEPAPTLATTAASAGTGTLCVYRRHRVVGFGVHWLIDIDGSRWGVLANGRYLCKSVEAGTHKVRVVHRISDVPSPPEVTTTVEVAKDETVHLMHSLRAGMVTDNLFAQVLTDEADVATWRAKLSPAKDKHR